MSNPPNLAASALAAAIERILATALSADSLGMDRLAALHGRRLRFASTSPAFEHTWIIQPDRVLIAAGDDGPADVTVSGPILPLTRLLARPELEPDAALQIDGEATLLADLQTALSGLSPDLAPLLEPLVGREGAAGADAVVNAGARVMRELADTAAEGVQEISQRLGEGGGRDAAGRLASALRELAGQIGGSRDRPER